jgi:hypothetical protein
MFTAQFLKEKFVKEPNKQFRSIKGVNTRLHKCAKAGLVNTNIKVSANGKAEIKTELETNGYKVYDVAPNTLGVSWE